MADALAVVAAGWGLMMAVAPILQIRRMLQRRSSADVSIGTLTVLQIGFCLWLAYGISLRNPTIYLPNSLAFLVGLVTIGVAYRYRER